VLHKRDAARDLLCHIVRFIILRCKVSETAAGMVAKEAWSLPVSGGSIPYPALTPVVASKESQGPVLKKKYPRHEDVIVLYYDKKETLTYIVQSHLGVYAI
jgi:hypothetical protein